MYGGDGLRSLLDLDDDVLRLIIETVWPRDLQCFISTCKRIYVLACDRLKRHRQLRLKYGSTKASAPVDRPLDILARIRTDPLIAHYVQRFQLAEEWDRFKNKDQAQEHERGSVLMAQEAISALALTQSNPRLSSCFDTTYPEHACQLSAIALILSLPNLESLSFCGTPISDMLTTPIFENLHSTPAHLQPLQHLKAVEIADRMGIWNGRADLAVWALAPQIKSLKCFHQFSHSFHSFRGSAAYQTHSSSLETFHLIHGDIRESAPDKLSTLLTPFKNLREFKHSAALSRFRSQNFIPGDRHIWDVAALIDSLASICANTLEVLHLVQTPCDTTLITSELLQLPKLKEFEGDIIMLLPSEFDVPADDGVTASSFHLSSEDSGVQLGCIEKAERDMGFVPNLVDIFPPSIERLILDIGRWDRGADMLLRDIKPSSNSRKRLLNLRRFSYHGLPLSKETYANLKASGVAVGRKSGVFYTPKFVKAWDQYHRT